uniref:F-box domain-containing protein n=1 Tax=Strongyloides papillosus TaxID=174720 RepID=A0A0N5B2T6_STREA
MASTCTILDILNNDYFAKNLLTYILSINDLDNFSLSCKAAYRSVSMTKNILVLRRRKFCTTLVISDKEKQRQVPSTGRIRTLYLNDDSVKIEKKFFESLQPDEIDMIDEVHFRIEDQRKSKLTKKYDDYAVKIAKIIDDYFEMFPNAKILNFMDSFNNHPSGFPLAVIRHLKSHKIRVITNININSIIRFYSDKNSKKNNFFTNLPNLEEFGFCIDKRKQQNLTLSELKQFEPFVEYLSKKPDIICTFYKTTVLYHTPENKTMLQMLLKHKLNIKVDHRLSWQYLSLLKDFGLHTLFDFNRIQHFNYTYTPNSAINRMLPKLQYLKSMSFFFPSALHDDPPQTRGGRIDRSVLENEWPLQNLRDCHFLEEMCIVSEIAVRNKDEYNFLPFPLYVLIRHVIENLPQSVTKLTEEMCIVSEIAVRNKDEYNFLPFPLYVLIRHVIENLPQSVTKLTIIANEKLTTKMSHAIRCSLPNLKELTLWNIKIRKDDILDKFKSLEFLHVNIPINFRIPASVRYLIVEHDIKECECLDRDEKPYKHDIENKLLFSRYPHFMLITQDHNIPIKVFYKNKYEKYRYQDVIRTFREQMDLFMLPI